ncbi:MAG TPA: polymer-forming cytoskeletal protein [Propionicimonas sp.]|jgi:cytoskeletal protein CcmA (bactofilin family)/Tfp pilus assembly protein PilX
MLVKRGARDEQGSALVSVLVIMLVLTMFALSLAAIVTNTSSTLISGRSSLQARATADAGVAAALAAFKKAQACTGTISSATAPVYSATCTADASTVTFTSTGSADDGRQAVVKAVYGYTTAQTYEANVGQLVVFSGTTMYAPNKVTSATTAPAKVIVAVGDLNCDSAMAANVVTEDDFYAHSGCAVSGWVKAKGDATLDAGSSVGQDLTTGGPAILNSVSSVGGSLTSGGTATLYSGSSVGKDLSSMGPAYLDSGSSVGGNLITASSADLKSNSSVGGDLSSASWASLDSGTSVGGNLIATGSIDVDGTVKGNLVGGSDVTTWDNSGIAGSVTAAGTSRTWIHGTVGKSVTAAGPVTIHYNSVVSGDVVSAGTSGLEVYGTVRGGLATAGTVLIDFSGSVGADITAAGTGVTSVYGRLTGDLKVKGTVYLDDRGTVSGTVSAVGPGITSIYGDIGGSLKLTGTVMIYYSGTVGADLTSSGTATDNIYGRVSRNVNAGGSVNLPAGSVGGNLTLPVSRVLTPSDAKTRVVGTVTNVAAPAPPGAPTAPTVSLTPPQVKVTAPTSPAISAWKDYGYSSADWPGYTVQVLAKTSSWCSASTWATYLATFTKPTVLDATACNSGLRQHAPATTTVTIQANVVVVSSEIDLQNITFKSATGTSPSLWFIVPSAGQSVKSYSGVISGNGGIDLYSTNIGVPAVLYTPNDISYYYSTFTGSMYSRWSDFNSGPPGDIKATPVAFPIAIFEATEPTTPTGIFSVTRLSQREVA